MIIKGGKVVARDGKIVAAPNGRYLPRRTSWPQHLRLFQKVTDVS